MCERNKEIAKRWFQEVWNERRPEVIRELFPPSGIGHLEGMEIQGPEKFEELHSEFLKAFPDLRFTIEHVLADEKIAAVRWVTTGTHQGHAFGLAATNRSVSIRGTTWMRIENGIVVEGWDTWNQGALIQSLAAS